MYQFYCKIEDERFDLLLYESLFYSIVYILLVINEVFVYVKVVIVNVLGSIIEELLKFQVRIFVYYYFFWEREEFLYSQL